MIDLSNENIIHIKGKDIEYLQFRKLLDYKIKHCYTLSTNNFDAFGNKTILGNEDKLIENYKKICAELNINYKQIVRPKQTHTNIVECINAKNDDIDLFSTYINVDGLLTNKNNIALSLGFADCTPILLYDTENKVIGNIHSGWRGTLQKIATVAIEKMKKEYNSNPENIIACIGPCIKQCHFEVKQDVYELFYKEFSYMSDLQNIIKREKENYKIDTTLININLLKEAGLKEDNIIDSKICTVCNSNYMHSYRAKGEKAGRNTAIMCM